MTWIDHDVSQLGRDHAGGVPARRPPPQISPDSRTVYLDHDAVVVAHARALLACDDRTVAVRADLRPPATILTDPAVGTHLDFRCPVAVLLVAVLHFVRPEEDPAAIVAAFRDALAPGSYLVISHVAISIANYSSTSTGMPIDQHGRRLRYPQR